MSTALPPPAHCRRVPLSLSFRTDRKPHPCHAPTEIGVKVRTPVFLEFSLVVIAHGRIAAVASESALSHQALACPEKALTFIVVYIDILQWSRLVPSPTGLVAIICGIPRLARNRMELTRDGTQRPPLNVQPIRCIARGIQNRS